MTVLGIPQVTGVLSRIAATQVPFATAMALNDTAADVERAEILGLRVSLDKPVPFTTRGIYKTRASKGPMPSVQIGVRQIQAGYLVWQVEGGVRGPKGRAIPVPVGIVKNSYGNMPKGKIAQMLARDDVFIASEGAKATAHLQPGIYQRGDRGMRTAKGGWINKGYGTKGNNWQGKGKKRSTLTMLVAFESSATYDAPPLDFYGIASAKVSEVYRSNFERRLIDAIRTAK